MGGARSRWLFVLAVLALALAPSLAAAFPGSNSAESPRANTPNDPEFDRCEADDPDPPANECSSYFEEEFRYFGFSPDSANQTPLLPHTVGGNPLLSGATRYANCSQLDAQGRAANAAAGDPECSQLAGIRADSAWKRTTGDPSVAIAILDTGIRWQDRDLVNKIRLNKGELPKPERANGTECATYDCDGNGAFDVRDYADDGRVAIDAGDEESDSMLDGSDLIATFSNGDDADGNGFADDIAGWDFFDDDNDPYDASSCCSANGHGSGRAKEAAAQTDNGIGGAGVCPRCQIIPLRTWDTFVQPTDYYASGVVYAAANGASVVEGAVGGLTNSRFAREAFKFADSKGLALMLVSSDINSANHNYPTNYPQAIYVAGSYPDTGPLDSCSGPGGLPGIGSLPGPPGQFTDACNELLGALGGIGIQATLQPITTSFFRNSNLTQYGGKNDIVLEATTGSENTGQAAGAAGLLASYGREVFGAGDPLSGNEIRQLLTMTAEDVLPANTGIIGLPDKARAGWDPHFGYGRVNLAAATKRIAEQRIPPEAEIDAPDWFAPIDVDRVGAGGVPVIGHVDAPHGAGVGAWELEYACGQDAADSSFAPVPGASGSGAVQDGQLGTLPKSLLIDLAEHCDGSVQNDFGRPSGGLGSTPGDPYPNPDPERHAFQIRLTAHAAGDPGNVGRYRKTLFAYHDDGNLPAWPRPLGSGSDAARYVTGSGGEASPRLYDLDGDNQLDILQATSSGELYATHADGTPVQRFNGGQPVMTQRYAMTQRHGVPAGLSPPRESLRVPAIGDIDGDRVAEIVATAGEHIYAWELDGTPVAGFPVGVDRSLSDPCVAGAPHPCFETAKRAITTANHIKRGFFGSAALADLDGDGRLDIVAGSMDQHVYAVDGEGRYMPGFPAKLSSPGADGAEIVTTPAIADLDGDGEPEIVIATNEVAPGDPQFPTALFDIVNALLASSTGSNPVYALHGDGSPVSGWPVPVGVAAGDLLPLVLPGHDAAILDLDGDGNDEVSVSAATSLAPGGPRLVDGDGTTVSTYLNLVGNVTDPTPIINLADYSSIGDLTGDGSPDVVKGGLTLNGAVNLLAPNQNLPFNHVEQAWDPASGLALPGFPLATDDFQLVSQASIARVGPGSARQALVGTGMYQLHAYGPLGAEPAGWPKFAGGWLQATPAVGDADGNGKLDVSTVTREGWSFLWDTGVDACGGSNDEWPTFHHDERSSANYGTDGRPPGTARGLAAALDEGSGAVTLSWREPGDDWLCGEADKLRVLTSSDRILTPADGEIALERQPFGAAGTDASVTLDEPGATHAAVAYRDEAGNWGLVRDVKLPKPGGSNPPGTSGCSNEINGSDGPDRLVGGAGRDLIRGKGGRDRLDGRGGGDCIYGGKGRDAVGGGAGDDRLAGGRGADGLGGGRGSDELRGGTGHDTLRGGRGHDTLRGGKGRDVVRAADGRPHELVDCGPGRDRAVVDRRDRVRRCEHVKRRR